MNNQPKFIDYKPDLAQLNLSPDDIEFCQSHMKETSKKPSKVPRFLYHATPLKNLSSILENGIKPHKVFGEIYFCEKERHCQTFIPSPAIIFRIDTAKLDHSQIFISNDHIKIKKRNFDAYSYFGPISAESCKIWRKV